MPCPPLIYIVGDKLDEVATQVKQPKEHLLGVAMLVISIVLLVILPGSFLFTVVGVGYPAYASIVCADAGSGEDAKQWLSCK